MKRSDIIEHFKEHVKKNPGKPGKKRVAIIDSISSTPAIYFPWKELVAICKEEGILSVIDAAHAIGQEVRINLTEVGPDFWVSVRQFTKGENVFKSHDDGLSIRTAINGYQQSVLALWCMFPRGWAPLR